ncbi:MAG: hypothetical protein GF419_11695 [Ignavibacteriales bacterium]|nr:hypothetical protein [Ignavibacteriales bacterium]
MKTTILAATFAATFAAAFAAQADSAKPGAPANRGDVNARLTVMQVSLQDRLNQIDERLAAASQKTTMLQAQTAGLEEKLDALVNVLWVFGGIFTLLSTATIIALLFFRSPKPSRAVATRKDTRAIGERELRAMVAEAVEEMDRRRGRRRE